MAFNANDQDFTVDPSSALAAFQKIMLAYGKMASGMTKDTTELEGAMKHFESTMGKMGDRTAQSQARIVKSYELSAAQAGQSSIDRIRIRSDALIKSLGTQEVLINKVRAATEKLIHAEKMREGGGGGMGGESFGQNPVYAFRAARDLFTGRTEFATVALGRLTYGLTGASVVATAGAAALAGFGVAAFQAAKHLGAYSDEVSNASIRTGLSTKEVEQFGFAAKTVGQDIGVFEGSMRQLTSAVEDFSGEGDKARKALSTLGVRPRDLEGNIRPTADILKELSSSLNAIPNAFERNALGMDIFKRKWLEIAPAMLAVEEKVKRAHELGFGATQEEIDRMSRYDDVLDEISQHWSELARKMSQGLVGSIVFTFDTLPGGLPGGKNDVTVDYRNRAGSAFLTGPVINSLVGPGRRAGESDIVGDFLRKNQESFRKGAGKTAYDTLGAEGARDATRFLESLSSTSAEQAQIKLGRLKGEFDAAANKMRELAQYSGPAAAAKQRDIVIETSAAYEKQKAIVKSIADAEAHRLTIAEALRRAEITAADQLDKRNLTPTGRYLREFSRSPGLGVVGPKDAMEQMRRITAPELQKEFQEGAGKMQDDVAKKFHDLTMDRIEETERARATASRNRIRELDLEHAGLSIQIHTMKELRESEERLSLSRVDTASILSADTPANRLQTEVSIASIRRRANDQELADANFRADREAEGMGKAIHARLDGTNQQQELDYQLFLNNKNHDLALFDAKSKHASDIFAIESEFDKQRATEQRRQLDSIKQDVTSLLETLFSHPSKFASQLGSTIRSAVLRPISEGIGERVAQGLHPSLYGKSGTGGLFGSLDRFFGGGTYSSPESVSYKVSTPPPPPRNVTLPPLPMTITPPSDSMYSPDFDWDSLKHGGGVGQAIPDWMGGGVSQPGAPGGTMGTFGPVHLGGKGRGGGWSGLSGLGNFDLSALKDSFGIGGIGIPGKNGMPGKDLGKIGSILSSKGTASLMLAAGLPLAMSGILGSRQGTWGGIGMAAGGGALTGAGIGTMILPGLGTALGAGIGAAAGFGIGLGEKIFGVESPSNHAKRLVRSQYGVSISSSMADSIVGIARQSYGGTVSIAVRSPEVRQMLGLYSAGTGQSMALSASVPRGAGLTQSGGSLFSNPVYQYGRSYTQSSPFPSYGGGGGGAPTYMSIHFDGKSAGDAMTGQFVTPSYVANASASAFRSSQGRLESAMMLAQPGALVS